MFCPNMFPFTHAYFDSIGIVKPSDPQVIKRKNTFVKFDGSTFRSSKASSQLQ